MSRITRMMNWLGGNRHHPQGENATIYIAFNIRDIRVIRGSYFRF